MGCLQRLANRYGEVARLRLGRHDVYSITDPQLVDQVLRGSSEKFDKGWRDVRHRRPPRPYRAAVQPAFHAAQMRDYAPLVAAAAEELLSEWPAGEERDLLLEMTALSLSAFSKALFATDLPVPPRALAAAVTDINRHLAGGASVRGLPNILQLRSRRRFRRAVARLGTALQTLASRRRADGARGDDLISRLIRAPGPDGRLGSDRDIRDQLLKPFTAGPDTTALLITYALRLLADHPAVERALREELAAAGPAACLGAGRPPLLDAVLREAMRLYPSLWVIGRGALEDLNLGGFAVPRGTQLLLRIGALHRDSRWFHEPDAFRPERWRGDFARRLPRGVYLPLGDGPHICLGNHFGLLLAGIAINTVLANSSAMSFSSRVLQLTASTTLRPKNRQLFKFTAC